MPHPTWRPDILEGFEQTSLSLPPAYDGPVEAVLVRRRSASGTGRGVLYVHGYVDYFFQVHLADFFNERGWHFYAVDLHRHGRVWRPHQEPNQMRDIDEFLEDVAAAVEVIVTAEGIDQLILNGHSTGGLVAALFAHRGRGRERVKGVFLNSPFLDMNLPDWQERWVEPVLAGLGRIGPDIPLAGLSPLYGESLHEDYRGRWSYDLRWKPVEGFPTRAGWFGAIHRAQEEVADGLDIPCPVLLLHAERSFRPESWTEEIPRADIVLDVEDMKRLAPGLGAHVEVHAVRDGIHDLVLSEPAARAHAFSLLGEWLERTSGTTPDG
jgi:alpha-beta hydrolase superfamily lysophospholipase